jgi:RNA polymerase sigma-70 factor (ECF subfamily)
MVLPNGEALDELAEKAASGDRQAFSEIVRRLMKPVVALSYRMTRDQECALDLAQETFVSVWQNLKSFRGDSQFESWLFAIAANKTLNYLRSAAGRTIHSVGEREPDLPAASDPEKDLAEKELRNDVLAFMQTLPEQQRLVFDLRFYKRMTFEEISRATGRALGTVKTHYREAVKKLRDFAARKGWR